MRRRDRCYMLLGKLTALLRRDVIAGPKPSVFQVDNNAFNDEPREILRKIYAIS